MPPHAGRALGAHAHKPYGDAQQPTLTGGALAGIDMAADDNLQARQVGAGVSERCGRRENGPAWGHQDARMLQL